MIKAVIFDCFNVLVMNSLKAKAEEAHRAKPELGDELRDLGIAVDRGMVDRREYIKKMAEMIEMDERDLESSIKDSLSINVGLVDFAKSLRERYKLGMLSNVSGRDRLDNIFVNNELEEIFDVVVASGDVGVVKPESAIYQLTSDKMGLRPDECVFIDDVQAFCDGAEATGMRAIHFKSTQQCITDLSKLLDQQG